MTSLESREGEDCPLNTPRTGRANETDAGQVRMRGQTGAQREHKANTTKTPESNEKRQ